MAKESNIAEVGETIYNIIFSAPSFQNVHKELLADVIPKIENSSSKSLLVLGVGPSGSPYHTVPDRFKKLFKNKKFKAVFLDYSPDILASSFVRYNKLGIIGENSLDSQLIVSDKNIEDISNALTSTGIQPNINSKSGFREQDLEGKLTFFQHNLQDPLPQELGNFDVIESAFTLHHVAQYVQTLSDRLNEIYSMLNENGLFHWSTGFCDMSYSEKKIRKIGESIANSLGYPITLIDNRQKDHSYKLTFSPDKSVEIEKGNGQIDISNQLLIDEEGIVYIPTKFLKESKAGEHGLRANILIDPRDQNDLNGLLIPVRDFYFPTNIEIANLKSDSYITPDLIKKAVKEDLIEKYNAERGLNEYYQSEKTVLDLLSNAGFSKIQVKRPNKNGKGFKDLVNVLSYK